MVGDRRVDKLVCGIDPGLETMGYALLSGQGDGLTVVDAGACRFDKTLPLAERLVLIDRDIASILSEHTPTVVAVEGLYAHYKHPRTAILMAHARGVILAAVVSRGIELRSYAATQVKRYLTGNGRATKGHVQRAVKTALSLDRIPEPEDMADALAIAMCCMGDVRNPRVAEVAR